MKKIFGIAPLLLILILGTCSSLQAQIVSVQPIHFEGGFSMLTGLTNNEQKENGRDQIQNTSTEKSILDKEVSECQRMNNENEIRVVEYKLTYSVWRYYNSARKNTKSGSYYYKSVSCKRCLKSK